MFFVSGEKATTQTFHSNFPPCEGLQGGFLKQKKMKNDLKAFMVAVVIAVLAICYQYYFNT